MEKLISFKHKSLNSTILKFLTPMQWRHARDLHIGNSLQPTDHSIILPKKNQEIKQTWQRNLLRKTHNACLKCINFNSITQLNWNFLIARLARSDPRNHFSACWPFAISSCHLLNYSVFRHVFISSLDMFKNCINSYHIDSEQV